MIKKTNNIFLFSILFIISSSLVAVFIIEYGLGYEPCNLCIYERIPYILSVFLILELIFLKKNEKITLLLISLIFAISAILAFYHFGIEQGLFTESFVCKSENFSQTLSNLITKSSLFFSLLIFDKKALIILSKSFLIWFELILLFDR